MSVNLPPFSIHTQLVSEVIFLISGKQSNDIRDAGSSETTEPSL